MKIKKIIPLFLVRSIYNALLKRKYDVKFGKKAGADLKTIFEGKNYINDYSRISRSYVGLGTYIAGHTSLSRIKIGKFCSIGQRIKTNLGVHPTHLISTHPSFYSDKKQAGFTFVKNSPFAEHTYTDENEKHLVEIGNDVWIGNDVTIMDGVKIGDGAIIGTQSLVTKDVEPYSIIGGIPAKIIRKRFSEEEIDLLLEFKWWNKDFSWIAEKHNSFLNKDEFFEEIRKGL